MEEIDVLLATYNGEMFIEEFLESLAGQEQVKIHLIVSDDGSTDSTVEIVKRYQLKFEKVTILDGPKKGPMRNFFHLLRNSSGKFLALADQDDIWNKDHLIKSINRIKESDLPAMTYSSVVQFGDEGKKAEVWPSNYEGPKFPAIIFENTARGCTIVINAQARQLINIREPKNAIMHDWWILLLLQRYGRVHFQPQPEIQYRLHNKNYAGAPTQKFFKFLNTLRIGRWLPLAQLHELLDSPESKFKKVDTFNLELFAKNLDSSLFFRFKNVIFVKGTRYRKSLTDEIKLRFGIIFLKTLNRNAAK